MVKCISDSFPTRFRVKSDPIAHKPSVRLLARMADEEPEAGGGGVRKTCTLQPATVAYLEKLVKVGTHGGTIPGVMTRLIEEGVRQALRDGFIKKPEES